MWHLGGIAVAAAEMPPTGGNDALLALIGGVIIAVIGGVVTISVNLINKPKNQPAPSGTAVDPSWRDFVSGELAVLKRRADDNDDRDDMQDRRLEHIERAKDHDHPDWRRR